MRIVQGNNPLREESGIARCNFRSIVFKDVYHIFEEDHVLGHWRIYKRTSKDGIALGPRQGPLFPLGDEGSFNEYGQADPTVIIDGEWKMWFDAMDRTYHWDKLGYATSPDGENWVNHGPVFSRGNPDEWDNTAIHHPAVLKFDGVYYLYYSGSDNIFPNLNVKHIGLATSTDGINFTKEKNPVLRTGDDWDKIYLRPSVPVFIDLKWYMFYWGFDGAIHSMGIATSTDLVNWTKEGKILSGTNEHDGITASQIIGNRIYYTTWDNAQVNYADIE